MANVAKDFAQLISQSKSNKTGPYDTQATVKRVEGNTVWVSIPGGVDETPIDKTVNCTAGDKVQVRVSGGRAWITGNASAPPTDDKRANEAKTTAENAQVMAVDAKETAEAVESVAVNANTTATNAQHIAEGVNEHFWHDNTGAHVTEVTQEEWNEPTDPNYHSGGNTLITTHGMAIRNGLTNLAEFGASGARIGQAGEAQAEVTQYAFSATDKEGDAFFIAEDLRNETGGVHTVTDTFISDGVTTNINLTYRATNTTYTVTVDGGNPPASMVKTQTQIVFGVVPQAGAVIVATYKTASQYAKAYTLGIRADNSVKGGMSVAEGEDCIASGRYSHAEGHGCTSAGAASHAEGISAQALYNACHAEGANTQANDHGSHAEGLNTKALGYASHSQNYYTKAEYAYQTAIGKYNDPGSNDAFEVGNGTSDNARSNAFTVKWNGDVKSSGDVEDGNGNVLADKADTSAVPTKTSDLTNDSGYITTETDPTVPSWAKASTKPTYTASEVGALPDTTTIPTKTSDLTNDSGFVSGLITEEKSIKDNVTVNGSGTKYTDGNASVAKTGYTPLGVVGFRVINASSSGTNGANVVISHAYISGTTAYFRVKNTETSSAKVRVYFTILYVKS